MAKTLSGSRRGWRVAGVALALALAAWGQKQPVLPAPPSVAWHTPAYNSQLYVPSDKVCEDCHRPEYLEFQQTAHAKLPIPADRQVGGCAMCHGPDRAHVEAEDAARGSDAKALAAAKLIFDFRTANPKQVAARCLQCHVTSKQQQFFDVSAHMQHGVACNSCHSAHLVEAITNADEKPLPRPLTAVYQVPQLTVAQAWLHDGQLKQPQPELCYGCHQNIQAKFALPFHHRVQEGLMQCTNCHTPHGTITASHQLNAAMFNACTKCHIEVQGPFVYEHPAVSVVGCVGCHNPHGSVNHFMLVRRQTRFICLECHTGFHAQAQVPHGRLGFQTGGDCTRCHIAVHGSNADPTLLH